MAKKVILPIPFIIAILLFSGYQLINDGIGSDKADSGNLQMALAGVKLGDTIEKVKAELGEDYRIEHSDDSEWWGEPVSRFFYGDDVEIVIGEETGQVLQINLNGIGYTTANGDQVGDTAQKVLSYYQNKYPPAKDHFAGQELPGWFVVSEGIWLIFNFNDDSSMVNSTIDPFAKVQSIHLVYERFLE